MDFLNQIIECAKADRKTIVLPESGDPRVLDATVKIIRQHIANVVLVGNAQAIRAMNNDSALLRVEIVDPLTSADRDAYAETLFNLRRDKGLTEQQAYELIKDNVHWAVMMVKTDKADGMVSGAAHSTADTVRPALQIIRTGPWTKLVSSFFVMAVPDCEYGNTGTFIFADCGLNQNPDAEALAEIAIASSKSFRDLVGAEPRVAMLSFSTYGSGKDAIVDKVIEATRIARAKMPGLLLDGELQADAALVPGVGASKAPGSPVAGRANVLIFPDLNSGNIAYKLVERLGKAKAYGPILQGIAKPVNDLSRGCSADDIAGVAAITAVQAQNSMV